MPVAAHSSTSMKHGQPLEANLHFWTKVKNGLEMFGIAMVTIESLRSHSTGYIRFSLGIPFGLRLEQDKIHQNAI
jgi:hypothetical protein